MKLNINNIINEQDEIMAGAMLLEQQKKEHIKAWCAHELERIERESSKKQERLQNKEEKRTRRS